MSGYNRYYMLCWGGGSHSRWEVVRVIQESRRHHITVFSYIILEVIPFGDWGAFGGEQSRGKHGFVLFMGLIAVRVFVIWYRSSEVQPDCWRQCRGFY